MFTGIIESIGEVVRIEKKGSNIDFTLKCPFTQELKIDQSLAHNGTCLTVVAIDGEEYTVTAINETLKKTNLGTWEVGTKVNLERCTQMNGRLDGHIVQGHVDTIGIVKSIEDKEGSFVFSMGYDANFVTVPQGSITVNGISLTVAYSGEKEFSVAIIPYTYEMTNMHQLAVGNQVNLEFDIIGKYVAKLMSVHG